MMFKTVEDFAHSLSLNHTIKIRAPKKWVTIVVGIYFQ